jgi:hypothetical protein
VVFDSAHKSAARGKKSLQARANLAPILTPDRKAVGTDVVVNEPSALRAVAPPTRLEASA